MVTVDVVIPCYNYARYLPACVHSVLSQPGVSVRALVIDDASSDETPRVGSELAASDDRVTYLRHPANRGHIATYNSGLQMATGEYVALLSADDLLAFGALARATALMENHPSVGFVYGFSRSFKDNDRQPSFEASSSSWRVWQGADWLELMCRAGRNFIHSPEVVMRTSIQCKIGGYRPTLPHSGDMEMWLRAASVSDVGRINGAVQAYYRLHSSNMHRTVHAGALVDLRGRRDAFLSALNDPDVRLPDAHNMLELANRSLATIALGYVHRAYETGSADSEPIEEYFGFAKSVFPEIVTHRRWRAAERRRRARPNALTAFTDLGRKLVRRLSHKLQWRIWQRTGIWRGAMP